MHTVILSEAKNLVVNCTHVILSEAKNLVVKRTHVILSEAKKLVVRTTQASGRGEVHAIQPG